MGLIEKVIAVVLLPLSAFIVLEATGIFSLNLLMDKIYIGAILMIVLQVLTIVFLKVHGGEIRPINIIIALVLIVPAASYILSDFIGFSVPEYTAIILGVMMFVEALYAFH